jgi:primosomal protein N'
LWGFFVAIYVHFKLATNKKKLERVLETEQKDLAKLKKQLEKESFQCEPDAKARLDAVLAENKTLHRLTGRVVRQQKLFFHEVQGCGKSDIYPHNVNYLYDNTLANLRQVFPGSFVKNDYDGFTPTAIERP